jgi:hypothetical protein
VITQSRSIWFPAKRYGWGWGLPIAWQGWLVMLAWIAVFTGGAVWLASAGRWGAYVLFSIAMAGALVAVCWVKGEKPRWRWGD